MEQAALPAALFSWTAAGLSGTWEEEPSPLGGVISPFVPQKRSLGAGAVLFASVH